MKTIFIILAVLKTALSALFVAVFLIGVSDDRKIARLTNGKTILKTSWHFLVLGGLELILAGVFFAAWLR